MKIIISLLRNTNPCEHLPKKNRKGTEGISDRSKRLQAEKLLDLFN